eukprot:TRINITY_DN3444_c0_g1_i1.p1 TRINITY_DN3444_c0_g1~~TRINITY_DN3444_c0_g1_i1.p1  ORF type:complete len:467 (+),score=117.27 TRINITY_DN3444_c0_g1_i1:1758-3158(+)
MDKARTSFGERSRPTGRYRDNFPDRFHASGRELERENTNSNHWERSTGYDRKGDEYKSEERRSFYNDYEGGRGRGRGRHGEYRARGRGRDRNRNNYDYEDVERRYGAINLDNTEKSENYSGKDAKGEAEGIPWWKEKEDRKHSSTEETNWDDRETSAGRSAFQLSSTQPSSSPPNNSSLNLPQSVFPNSTINAPQPLTSPPTHETNHAGLYNSSLPIVIQQPAALSHFSADDQCSENSPQEPNQAGSLEKSESPGSPDNYLTVHSLSTLTPSSPPSRDGLGKEEKKLDGGMEGGKSRGKAPASKTTRNSDWNGRVTQQAKGKSSKSSNRGKSLSQSVGGKTSSGNHQGQSETKQRSNKNPQHHSGHADSQYSHHHSSSTSSRYSQNIHGKENLSETSTSAPVERNNATISSTSASTPTSGSSSPRSSGSAAWNKPPGHHPTGANHYNNYFPSLSSLKAKSSSKSKS